MKTKVTEILGIECAPGCPFHVQSVLLRAMRGDPPLLNRGCSGVLPQAGNAASWGIGEFPPCASLGFPMDVHLLDYYYLKTSPVASPMRCLGPALPAQVPDRDGRHD